jgi:ribosomal RNA-processing protein 9
MTNDEKTIYSGSKDNSVIQWDVESHKKHIIKPFWSRKLNDQYQMVDGEILAIAVTTDGKYIVSGGRDNTIRIYDVRQKYAEIKTLTGHRDAITSLCFKRESYSLFSGSLDRCIKHWDLNEMGYIETMFGHQVFMICICG